MSDDFDGPEYLYLKKGNYKLEFRLDGFETKTVDVAARPGAQFKVEDKLKKIPGSKQYGSYNTPTPEGGLQRYRDDGVHGRRVVRQTDARTGSGPRPGRSDAAE